MGWWDCLPGQVFRVTKARVSRERLRVLSLLMSVEMLKIIARPVVQRVRVTRMQLSISVDVSGRWQALVMRKFVAALARGCCRILLGWRAVCYGVRHGRARGNHSCGNAARNEMATAPRMPTFAHVPEFSACVLFAWS